jgi:predicted ATPase
MSKLDEMTVKGYKSIKSLDNFELRNINLLIGSNGAGKSNFISLFKFLENIYNQNLQSYVEVSGGPDALLCFGRKTTNSLKLEFKFAGNGYNLELIPTDDNRLILSEENSIFYKTDRKDGPLALPISFCRRLF